MGSDSGHSTCARSWDSGWGRNQSPVPFPTPKCVASGLTPPPHPPCGEPSGTARFLGGSSGWRWEHRDCPIRRAGAVQRDWEGLGEGRRGQEPWVTEGQQASIPLLADLSPSSPQSWEQGGLLLPGHPVSSELVPGARPYGHHSVRPILEEGAAEGRCAHHR